ncbi:ATP/GTP-binding protein [Egicoccus sp. AB-alg6-2]|uniref:GTP-binding protein n=1 Tax=Egicoccus sp. AB-alg6-2 TaxID=3242692 RepID=UPI00359D485B
MTGVRFAGSHRRPVVGSARHPSFKVLVTGPFDAGKTTLIETISEVQVVSTERDVSDWASDTVAGGNSGRTTVAMDYGRIAIDRDLALHLFGTPGQERFEFMWDILAEGMLGFVLVVDARRPETLVEARGQQVHFAGLADVPLVVAVNKLGPNSDTATVLDRVRGYLDVPAEVAVLATDVRDREDVKRVLLALLHAVAQRLRARAGDGPAGPPAASARAVGS